MRKEMKTALKKVDKITNYVKKRLNNELSALAKSGIISKREAKQMLRAAAKEAEKESRRVAEFITQELRRELKKAKPAIKKTLAIKRKQFEKYKKQRAK
jgi:hypothetical protein